MSSEKLLLTLIKFFIEKLGCAEGMAKFMAEQLIEELEAIEALR